MVFQTMMLSEDEAKKYSRKKCIPLNGTVSCSVDFQKDYSGGEELVTYVNGNEITFPYQKECLITLPTKCEHRIIPVQNICAIDRELRSDGCYITPTKFNIIVSQHHPFMKDGRLKAQMNVAIYDDLSKNWVVTSGDWVMLDGDDVEYELIDTIDEAIITVNAESVLGENINMNNGFKITVSFIGDEDKDIGAIDWALDLNKVDVEIYGIYKTTIPPTKTCSTPGYAYYLVDTSEDIINPEPVSDTELHSPVLEEEEEIMTTNTSIIEEPFSVTPEIEDSGSLEDIESIEEDSDGTEVPVSKLNPERYDSSVREILSKMKEEIDVVTQLTASHELLSTKVEALGVASIKFEESSRALKTFVTESITSAKKELAGFSNSLAVLSQNYEQLLDELTSNPPTTNTPTNEITFIDSNEAVIKSFSNKFVVVGHVCKHVSVFGEAAETGECLRISNSCGSKITVEFDIDNPLTISSVDTHPIKLVSLNPKESLICCKYKNSWIYLEK